MRQRLQSWRDVNSNNIKYTNPSPPLPPKGNAQRATIRNDFRREILRKDTKYKGGGRFYDFVDQIQTESFREEHHRPKARVNPRDEGKNESIRGGS